jgi:hypothetical protein
MPFRFILVVLAALIFSTPSVQAADEGVIGTIVEIEGTATVNSSPATANAQLHLNDVVETGAGSRVFILFIDNTEMTMSENTQVKLDSYIYDPDSATGNGARYSILKGAFQYVSGLIGKSQDPDVQIETPVGSIGIRGTDFWAGEIDGEYGVSVNEGRVALKTDAGEEQVQAGQGTFARGRGVAPTRAAAWKPEKLQRVAATVKLQRRAFVRQQINAMQGRQQQLRMQHKEFIKTKREGMMQQRQEMQQNRQEKAQQNQEKRQEQMQQNQRKNQEQNQQRMQQMQQNRQNMIQQKQQMMQQKRNAPPAGRK